MPDMSASLALTHLVPLAKEVDENKVTPGVLGFIVFAALALAVWGLMKSMNRHMGKVTFEEDPEKPEKGAVASGKGSGSGPGGKASPAKG
ncbi:MULTISPECIES: hypothetical protein [Streptomyces]|jgi:hypothetical protein|uniref:Ribosome associated membrane protein RAMP4 n=1 Tax=Streptomyces mirabilis TaxID=68239 RepID=A0ABU3ULS5_9ACTN|nr:MULTISPECIES: hypothetical protein [Streptomyces]KAF5995147.1 hypothetical protein BOG92_028430 [Streptomyces sp. WAC00263]MCX4421789.1 hypothetical protein [Streptomyces mirabilis]MCX4611421.1 hypothetical protein [Streptomyces mirabilis]MCX5351634.1 hypothetical protein [Streptomyces mirabilis]MCZ1001779.1 hypothetical protein [Streptomyces mirabilis]